MISPFTHPGTKIVCVDVSSNFQHVSTHASSGRLDGLTKDEVYTVLEIRPDGNIKSGYEVLVREIARPSGAGFALERFRLLDLPEAITRLLEAAPLDAEPA
ncbi:hypothetical protein [Methylocella sp.]|uniref:hypothetical protein n=1 Tax=Methylocella sp. TaxID=1978226 RepID=UPI003785025E